MARVSKPTISTTDIVAGNKIYSTNEATRFGRISTAIDALIDDYLSLTDGTAQSVSGAVTFSAALTASAGLTMEDDIVMGSKNITGLAAPSNGGDAVNKTYADSLGLALAGSSGYLPPSGSDARPTITNGTVTDEQLTDSGYLFPNNGSDISKLDFSGVVSSGPRLALLGVAFANTDRSNGNYVNVTFGTADSGSDGEPPNPDNYSEAQGANQVFVRGSSSAVQPVHMVWAWLDSNLECWVSVNTETTGHELDIWLIGSLKLIS